ncbi:DNA-binding transcriptional LysR family regulator [Rhizobium sp. SLBN-94]|nr:DNA-binding transcriptional LysR family regulator [Rhizobium sp. SLBN-94]
MIRDELGSLTAFAAVAEAKSFTRAAGRLGTSQSALSHRIRRLEERLGVSLLLRNTRSVAVTQAGARLLETLGPALLDIEDKLNAIRGEGSAIAGSLRISSADHAAEAILWPALQEVIPRHPGISVEVIVDNRLVDIVAERFDAGIRLGNNLDDDMIAIPIGPRERAVVVASPGYLSQHGKPSEPGDLSNHQCINRRMPSLDGITKWTFQKDRTQQRVRVSGALAFDRPEMIMEAAVAGFGVAYLLQSQVRRFLDAGQLVAMMEEWTPEMPGYHLYYPGRKQKQPALDVLVEAIRYQENDERQIR